MCLSCQSESPKHNFWFVTVAYAGACTIALVMDNVKADAWLVQKITKHHILRDIENSFNEGSHVGLEPHQFFSC